ncbi:MAG: (2Fe-2S) ferredoxin domain-containing protein, partial [Bacilli bacterium]|nr:(2Fe-2S) ferredoxin domain-containing protein [Bacilli bacterium]
MEKILNPEALDQKIAECTEKLNDKLSGKGGKRAILVCGGTGCLANDSQPIFDKIAEELKARHLDDKVSVTRVGCFGMCSQGPFVKILPEDTLYCKVKPTDVEKIMTESIEGGKIIEELL